ncbi:MAG: hypothetical protein V4723_05255 [Pseudomonadota bacterium]
MRFHKVVATTTMLFAAGSAYAACTPIRLGYIDHHRPPYYMGAGTEQTPSGASVDLIRLIAASSGCTITSVRLPMPRLRAALESGLIDAMPMDAGDDDAQRFALPKTKDGRLDRDKALRFNTVVFVRTSDKLPKDTDPLVHFKSHRLGINQGSPLAAQLRQLGYAVDDGAIDVERNIEKLIRNRIDGYGASMVAATDMDAVIAARFGKQVFRLEKPLHVNNIWLAFSKAYRDQNPKEVEAMWNWVGTHGRARFAEIVKQYEEAATVR